MSDVTDQLLADVAVNQQRAITTREHLHVAIDESREESQIGVISKNEDSTGAQPADVRDDEPAVVSKWRMQPADVIDEEQAALSKRRVQQAKATRLDAFVSTMARGGVVLPVPVALTPRAAQRRPARVGLSRVKPVPGVKLAVDEPAAADHA